MTSKIIEEWRPVPGYEGLYEVSNNGAVASLNYRHTGKRVVLTQKVEPTGYRKILLYKEGKRKMVSVHRIVADAFIPKVDGLDFVNHKDERKGNNNVNNLEWCTKAYNNNYGSRKEAVFSKLRRPVIATLRDGTTEWYPSVNEAGRALNYSPSNISSALNGKLKTACKREWRWANV